MFLTASERFSHAEMTVQLCSTQAPERGGYRQDVKPEFGCSFHDLKAKGVTDHSTIHSRHRSPATGRHTSSTARCLRLATRGTF